MEARELIKINVLQNCADDPKEIAQIVAERTHSQVVQVIGKRLFYIRSLRITRRLNFLRIIRRNNVKYNI